MSILDEILRDKFEEVEEAKRQVSLSELQIQAQNQPPALGVINSLKSVAVPPVVIAEIKRASPSKGIIREELDPLQVAKAYFNNGAAALSVLTDEKYFQGKLSFVGQIKAVKPDIPVLRKDFILDSYQVWESRVAGADAILLIARALSGELLCKLFREAAELGMDTLIELHSEGEIAQVFELLKKLSSQILKHAMFGVNNRDLDTFKIDLALTCKLAPLITKEFSRLGWAEQDARFRIVSESGINTGTDISYLNRHGVSSFLIGESLMAQGDPGINLKVLIADAQKNITSII